MAISEADVHAAADQLVAEGRDPTLSAIRDMLGKKGSYTTISDAMKVWRAQQKAAAAPIREAAPAAVIERTSELASEVWSVALALANERLTSEREALESTRKEMELAQTEAADLADQMADDLEAARAQIEQQLMALEQYKRQAAELAEAKEAAHTAQAALTEAQKRGDHLAALLDKERAATAAAQLRSDRELERAARAEQQVRDLELQIDHVQAALTAAQQRADSLSVAAADAQEHALAQAHALEQKAVQLVAAEERSTAAKAALLEAQRRADDLAAMLEKERSAVAAAQVKTEESIAKAARLEGTLEALQKQNSK